VKSSGTLEKIKRRFAGHERAIERAFETSELFRSLCADYLACTTALARWRKSEGEQAARRATEYAELLTELTSEIDACLEAEERVADRQLPTRGE